MDNKHIPFRYAGIFLTLFVFCLLSFVFILSCSRTPTRSEGFTLSGRVVLEDTTDYSGVRVSLYRPVELDTALVRINQEYPNIGVQISQETEFDHREHTPVYTTTTDKDGNWKIEGVEEGEYNIVAEKEGWGWRYVLEYDLNKDKIIEIDLFSDSVFTENNEERCYFCKKEIIKALKKFKNEIGYKYIMDATNKSDLSDYRPGILALMEEGIISPLLDAEITKEDIIELSKEFGLEIKPPESCLATRIPVYTRIEKDTIEKIRFIENRIKKLGIKLVRARVHENLLRLQFLREDLEKVMKNRKEILDIARKHFTYATIDLKCYDE